MKIILTIAGLEPQFGGPSQTVPALARALKQAGIETELVACRSKKITDADRFVKCATQNDSVIHDNGLWLPNNHAIAQAARNLKRPLIISPRGMLSRKALEFKGWKKRLAWLLYQRRDLMCAKVLHATSQREAEDFRARGLAQPVAVVPNGVEIPDWRERPGGNKSLRTVLFLGRLHPIKGLPDLIAAWSKVRPQGWHVVVAGNDVGWHRGRLEKQVRENGLERDFNFVGAVNGEAKWNLLRGADLFVLPSRSENFGLAVAEALACGTPVITTHGTPWEDLQTHKCGWWVPGGAESLAVALKSAIVLPDAERREMGLRGRKLVEEKFTWPRIAEQMVRVYSWMLGKGDKPETIV